MRDRSFKRASAVHFPLLKVGLQLSVFFPFSHIGPKLCSRSFTEILQYFAAFQLPGRSRW